MKILTLTDLRKQFDDDSSINRTMKIELNFLNMTLLTMLKKFFFNKISCNNVDLNMIDNDKFKRIVTLYSSIPWHSFLLLLT